MSDKVVNFYRIDPGEHAPVEAAPPDGVSVRLWRPGSRAPGPETFMGRSAQVYRLFHGAHLFSNRDYSAICLEEDGKTLHISTVFPRFFRFPFMRPNDLQIGATFTREDARGRGLAKAGLYEATVLLAAPDRAFWYLTDADNLPSCRVAEAAGFHCVGTGARIARLGIGALSAYRLTNEFESDGAAPAQRSGKPASPNN